MCRSPMIERLNGLASEKFLTVVAHDRRWTGLVVPFASRCALGARLGWR
jgi:hypothetical protein